jgi:hypothetical protein
VKGHPNASPGPAEILGLAEYLGGSPDAAEAYFAESLDLARRAAMLVKHEQ